MDPVRFLSNPSSGAMGIAVAEELAKRGASVTLVLGPTHLRASRKVKTIKVTTALEMAAAVKKNLSKARAFVATAAVGDWRFERIASRKLKKSDAPTMTVRLVKNPDILAMVSRSVSPIRHRNDAKARLLIGFALETDAQTKNALKKLRAKNLDLIVANDPSSFARNRVTPTLIERSGATRRLPAMTKKALARKIAQWLDRRWKR